MPDVISLCDSDSDEDELRSRPVQKGKKETAVKEVVDLLGDSSSDEEDLTAAAHKGKLSETKAFVKSNASSSKDLATAAMSSKRRRSHDKKTAAVVARPCDDSDSDSDDSILNYESGLTWKKKSYESSAPLSRSTSEFKIATPTLRYGSATADIAATIPAKKVSPDSSPTNLETLISQYKSSSTGCDSNVQPSQAEKQSDNSLQTGDSLSAFPTPSQTIINPYTKTKNGLASHCANPATLATLSCSVPREDLPMVQYPDLLPGAQSYPDIRPKLILALWKRSKTLVNFSHDGKKLDNTVKKIVALALSEYPLRSMDEYLARYFGVGGVKTTSGRIQREEVPTMEDLDKLSTPVDACRDGRYYSIAEAGLVAVLEEMELQLRAKNVSLALDDHNIPTLSKELADKDTWMSLDRLILTVDQRLKLECPGTLRRRNFLDQGAAYYMEASTRSAEFLQLKNLLKTPRDANQPFLKQHTRAGQTLFEMTLLGYQTAIRIRSRHFPAPPGHYRRSNLASFNPRYENICLGVDIREGGGPASVLHIM
jgi:hypothetical protein